ncbi:MAG: DUF1549 and DUF1553 domain-containing protein, partial [Planctomycetota bacterium]
AIWPYRDWVIAALNRDQGFDEFSVEQLAGDMLPDATRPQRIATGFHRNTMLNEEGGIDPLEYRYYSMVDRVATTGTVWMGLTIGCAQCHTHKYDPITHTDYYAMMALMDDADEPELEAVDLDAQGQRLAAERAIHQMELEVMQRVLVNGQGYESERDAFNAWRKEQGTRARDWVTCRPVDMRSTSPFLDITAEGTILASGDATKRDEYVLTMPPLKSDQPVTAIRIAAIAHDSLPAGGPGLAYYEGRRGDFFLSEIAVSSDHGEIELSVGTTSVPEAKPGQGKTFPGNVIDGNGSTGWSIPGEAGQTHRLVIPLKEPQRLNGEWKVRLLFERHYVAALGHFRVDVTTGSDPVALSIPSRLENQVAQDPASSHEALALEFLRSADAMKPHRQPIMRLRRELKSAPRTLVLRERSSDRGRVTHRHHRGEYLQPREAVDPAIPRVFSEGGPANANVRSRLEFARWLVGDENPLVGRVTANRAWRMFFGTGIVRTVGDFGLKSESPSHPELLDFLDASLRDASASGMQWSLKRLHREIVLSSTYRLAIGAPPSEDPDNRLLSVFPYQRYDAERIRDSFLAAAGLLVDRIGGPSVFPPQPNAVMQIAYG